MAIGTFKAAKALGRYSEWSLTNLKMQKILYIAHMIFLGKNNEPLINDTFEAWDYGPVLPNLYHKIKVYGREHVKEAIFFGVEDIKDESKEAKILEEAATKLSSIQSSKLISFTHKKNGAWYKCYDAGANNPIPREQIINEYKSLKNEQ